MSCSFELEHLGLCILDGKPALLKPVLDVSLECPLLHISYHGMQGEPPKCTMFSDILSWELRSLNKRLGCCEPVLKRSTWHLSCEARPAFNQAADRSEAVVDVEINPVELVNLVVTVPFVHLCARLLQGTDNPSGGVQVPNNAHRRKTSLGSGDCSRTEIGILMGINLTGLTCCARANSSQQATGTLIGPAAVPLDLIAENAARISVDQGADSTDEGTLWLSFPQLPAEPSVAVPLEGEAVIPWQTSVGTVLVRIVMPQPPQRLLLVTSTTTFVNRNNMNLELKLLLCRPAKEAGDELQARCSEFCMPNAYLAGVFQSANGSSLFSDSVRRVL
eukprot:TRINITY_DN17821_c0_g1_i1.p1 TRINITY_DN17821_c0_g1~~TRINITY_DN17821_c0_g1_i1.p1  ORF type:complete len:333 (-),score=49.91 TRINITY_DN17821_c0_g1_i1:14-1012(-)